MDRTHRSLFIIVIIVIIVTLLAATTLASAQEPNLGAISTISTITADDVYVRSGPGDSYYPFGKVNTNNVVSVIGEKFNWTRVLIVGPTFNDFFGYVRLPKTDTSRLEVQADGKTARVLGRLDVLAPNLNSKNNPDHSWKRIAELDAKATVRIEERIETDRAIVYKIALPATAEGWISSTFVGPATPSQIAAWKAAGDMTLTKAQSSAAPMPAATPAVRPIVNSAPVVTAPAPVTVAEADDDRTAREAARAMPRHEEQLDPPVRTPAVAGDALTSMTETPEAELEVIVATPPVFEVDAVIGNVQDDDDDWTAAPQEIHDATESVRHEAPVTTPQPATIVHDPAPAATSLVNTYYDDPRFPRRDLEVNRDQPQRSEPQRSEPQPPQPAAPRAQQPDPQPFEMPVVATVTEEIAAPAMPERIVVTETVIVLRAPQAIQVMGLAAAQTRLNDLEAAYRRLKAEPITDAEVLPLHSMYVELGASAAAHDAIARYAAARAEQLTIWAELQSRRLELTRLREQLSATAQQTRIRIEEAQAGGLYVAVGRLTTSTIFDGTRLPQLYRIQDPRSGRSLGYLRPNPQLGLDNLVGQYVGVAGRLGLDEQLKVELLTPQRVDRLNVPEG